MSVKPQTDEQKHLEEKTRIVTKFYDVTDMLPYVKSGDISVSDFDSELENLVVCYLPTNIVFSEEGKLILPTLEQLKSDEWKKQQDQIRVLDLTMTDAYEKKKRIDQLGRDAYFNACSRMLIIVKKHLEKLEILNKYKDEEKPRTGGNLV